jgi:UDP-GlcNAc:undecaprenyl-phosphate GlcNAc-1-phosphate transferase
MGEYLPSLVIFGVAFAATAVATPVVRRLAPSLGALDTPSERHIHTSAIPSLGGLAMLAGLLAAVGAGVFVPAFEAVYRTTSEPEAIVLASLVIAAVGFVDDTTGVSPPAKLAAQIVGAGMLALFGLSLLFVYIPGSPGLIQSLGPEFGALLTVAVAVVMINAVNLADGLDGLAAGIAGIAAVALFVYVQLGDPQTFVDASAAPLVLAAVAGVCAGFLVHNFHPASIFMGDTGAMLLGLLLAAGGLSAIRGTTPLPSRGDFAAFSVPVLIPLLVLAVPLLDTVWTIARRLRMGRALFSPDKKHLHHRLLEIGHSHRRVVLIMYYWSALVAFVGVGVSLLPMRTVATVLGAGVALAVGYSLVGRVLHRAKRRKARRTDPTAGRSHAMRRDASPRGDDGFVPTFTSSQGDPGERPADQRKGAGRSS